MAAVNFSKVFPCAKAPFDGDGKFRLWTEENITKVLRLVFDVDGAKNKAFISKDKKTLVIYGYIFEATGTATFDKLAYYIAVSNVNNELLWNANNAGTTANWTAALYDSSPTQQDVGTAESYTVYGGPVTPIKCAQEQLPDLNLGTV